VSFGEFFSVLIRRWYLTAIAIVLGVLVAGLGFFVSGPKYEAHAQLLLLPSVASVSGEGPGNPFLGLSDSLGEAAQVIAAQVADSPTAAKLASEGFTGQYTVELDTSLEAPVIRVQATDPDSHLANSTMRAVIQEFQARLASAQRAVGAPANTLITTTTVTETPTPNAVRQTQIRNAIVGAILGVVIGLTPVFIVERRSTRRQAASTVDGDGGGRAEEAAAATAPATRDGDESRPKAKAKAKAPSLTRAKA